MTMSEFLHLFQAVVPYLFGVVLVPAAGCLYAGVSMVLARRRMTRLAWSFGRAGAVLFWATLPVWVALLIASGFYAYGIGALE